MINQASSEQRQLTECSKGNADAFNQIYQQYKNFVFNVVNARLTDTDDALDITQDIFVNLWASREQLANIRDFKTYLFVFSRNQVISAYRKKNVRLKGENYIIERLEEQAEPSAEDHRFARELTLHIDKAVNQFPETMRHCYQLSKNEGKRNIEIAEILNISEKTVRNNVSEALKRLRLNLQNSYSELLTGAIALLGSDWVSVTWHTIHKK
ncbi:RNA polymerase sigma factor [Mucilaginibacter paludis]|uniref:RNA polymerase, sigma-24 subunit, ECF subfamily n=1 Tax=Mucilaginibacter paludis DSM 18603 TaxID=714943 RepID=H1Y5U8_9SPHI|nr:sigma-70 family RNA polymerase sigma factor [Mucilaginibacter paludis]EHQ30370.1 RNA polymerase, sigma-24 subunit, ECF subfamily [Mucilaginibacter paludis DSM 18603]